MKSSELQSLFDQSESFAKQAFENNGSLASGTNAAETTSALLEKLKSLSILPGDKFFDDYCRALKLAWLAKWRSADFTIDGWNKRLQGTNFHQNSRVNSFLRNDFLAQTYTDEFGATWPKSHIPPFDLNGDILNEGRAKWNTAGGRRDNEFSSLYQFISTGMVVADPNSLNLFAPTARLELSCILPNAQNAIGPVDELIDCFVLAQSFENANGMRLENCIAPYHLKIQSAQLADLERYRCSKFCSGLLLQNLTDTGDTSSTIELIDPNIDFGPQLTVSNAKFRQIISIQNLERPFSIVLSGSSIPNKFRVSAPNAHAPLSLKIQGTSGTLMKVEDFDASDTYFGVLEISLVEFQNFRLHNSRVLEDTTVSHNRFSGDASFDGAELQISSSNEKSFTNCTFEFRTGSNAHHTGPTFLRTSFLGAVNFDHSTFMNNVSFDGAQFVGDCTFRNTPFNGNASFDGDETNRTNFFGLADFSADHSTTSNTFSRTSFNRVRFHRTVDFSNRIFGNTTKFESSVFDQLLLLHGAICHQNISFRNSRFLWQSHRVTHPFLVGTVGRVQIWIRPLRSLLDAILKHPKKDYGLPEKIEFDNAYFKSASSAFRTLRKAMEDNEDNRQAAIFHREELKARQLRFGDKEVPRSDAWISALYGVLSDYGESIGRSILAFLSIGVISFALYALIPDEDLPENFSDRIAPAAWVAIEGQTRPFYHLNPVFSRPTKDIISECTRGDAMAQTNSHSMSSYCYTSLALNDGAYAFKSISLAQSLLSITTLFLILLGVRRKLQM
nr:pentapeptide repeat-containing protein [uncultured Hyphomonas sp.]